MMMTLKILLLFALPLASLGFVPSCRRIRSNRLCVNAKAGSNHCDEGLPSLVDSARRNVLFQLATAGSGGWIIMPRVAHAAIGSAPDHPVAILGGGGRTGMEVAKTLAQQGIYAVTMTRTGKDPFQVIKLPEEVKRSLSHYDGQVDVRHASSLEHTLQSIQASAIVYCASASKQGGTAFEVDDEGVGHAAEAARDLGARFILVSTLAVDRPESKSFQITNSLGGNLDKIMDAKRQGEEKVRLVLSKERDYVIVRPGPLVNSKSRNGAADIELNQGDEVGGGISRDELAGVVVGALLSNKHGATVEAYRKSTATKLQPEFQLPSGRESTSDTYVGLFDNVEEGP